MNWKNQIDQWIAEEGNDFPSGTNETGAQYTGPVDERGNIREEFFTEKTSFSKSEE